MLLSEGNASWCAAEYAGKTHSKRARQAKIHQLRGWRLTRHAACAGKSWMHCRARHGKPLACATSAGLGVLRFGSRVRKVRRCGARWPAHEGSAGCFEARVIRKNFGQPRNARVRV